MAHDAFASGLHIVAALSALVPAGTAILNAIVLRPLPAFGQAPQGPPPEEATAEEAVETPEDVVVEEPATAARNA